MARSPLSASAVVIGALVLGATQAGATSPASHFVDATLSPATDARDSLATGFDPRQLPLLMAALEANPPADVSPARLYRALTRWHYYAGREFDPQGSGLWTAARKSGGQDDARTTHRTLANGAALELVELAALARLAGGQDHAFDPVVWWYDHLELRRRLANTLYEPIDGSYVNLDSLGRPAADPLLSGLIPVALGARHGGQATRRAAWRLWTGSPERAEQGDLVAELEARRAAEDFEHWGRDRGLHLISPATMAALSLAALEELDEPTLSVFARDALAGRGIAARDSIEVRLGGWKTGLAIDDLRLRPLERSAAALRFLTEVGVFAEGVADSLSRLASLRADVPADSVSASVSALTDVLVDLRSREVRTESGLWSQRRAGANDLDPADQAAFDFQWADLHIWYDRALDLITADILAWHLRPNYRSSWTVALDPPVVGHGDQPVLRIHARSERAASETESDPLTLMWTDGARLLPPAQHPLRRVGDRDFECAVPDLPRTNGLWHLIVEGLADRPRIAAAASVVEPVLVSVVPVERRGSTVDWSVQLRSQVRSSVSGRVDLESPLNWTAAPGTSLPYTLDPGSVHEMRFSLTPDRDVAPGTYPIRWTVWSNQRLVGDFDVAADQPFAWLRVGPLPVTEPDKPIDSRYAFDRQIDLAQRVQGVDGTAAWTRLPAGSTSADGFVQVARPGGPPGIHYAFTAFVTQSRESILDFESAGPAQVFVNGRTAVDLERWGGRREAEVEFGAGTNFVVVKLVGSGPDGARFRLRLHDIDGRPLQALANGLEHLVENYAYLARARRSAEGASESQLLRLVPIQFEHPTADTVSVVGSFNGWSPSATPMTRLANGNWQAKIRLRPGRFEYKFAVDGTEWVPDPANPDAVADGFGGRNSVLMVD